MLAFALQLHMYGLSVFTLFIPELLLENWINYSISLQSA